MNFDHERIVRKGVGVTRTKFDRRNQTGATQWPLDVETCRRLRAKTSRSPTAERTKSDRLLPFAAGEHRELVSLFHLLGRVPPKPGAPSERGAE